MPDWNAESYHRVSQPQWNWGLTVLSSLTLDGDETVIDAGCGTGRLTAVLLERLPQGRAIALDSSESMLQVARRELARFGERAAVMHGDLGHLTLNAVADVVFSTATFHWVQDHAAMARGLFDALKSNGRLHAQCGGAGNLTGFLKLVFNVARHPPFAAYFDGYEYPARFSSAEAMQNHLAQAGFNKVECSLTPAPASFESREAFAEFVSTVVLRTLLARLPSELQQPYLEAVVSAAPMPYELDYVRLEIRAKK